MKMKLIVLIFTFSLSFTALAFVKGRDFERRFTLHEKPLPAGNSGIILKNVQQQDLRNSEKTPVKYPVGQPGEWQLLKKAERKSIAPAG